MNEVVSASATFLWYRQHQLKMLCNTAENCMPWLTWCLLLWNGWHPFDQEMSVIINSLWAGINTIDKAQHPCSVHVCWLCSRTMPHSLADVPQSLLGVGTFAAQFMHHE